MKQLLQSALPVLLSIILLSCSGGYEPLRHLVRHPQITLEISLDKDVYAEGEPIWLIAKFKNFGKLRDSLPDLHDEYAVYANLLIESDSAPAVKYYGPVVDRLCPVYSVIKTGETYIICVDVRQFWVNKYLGRGLFNGYIVEGIYQIECNYSSGWSYDDIRISSNKLSFRVSKPSEIIAQSLDTLIDIFKSKQDHSEQLYRFYNNHAKSVYAEEAFYYYTVMRILDKNKIKVDSTFLNECYEFFENYPDSYYKYEILRKSLWAYQLINGKNQKNYKFYLKYIKSKYPVLSECVERLIKNDTDVRNSMKWYREKVEQY